MHQFYCRAQRWREPRREVAQMRRRRADKRGVKRLGMCQDKARRNAGNKIQVKLEFYSISNKRESCGNWQMASREPVRGGNEEQKRNKINWWGENWMFFLTKFTQFSQAKRNWSHETKGEEGMEVRADARVTDRNKRRGSRTTNQLNCLITSCIPPLASSSLHSPILLLPDPLLLVHLHGNQTGCLIHELNIFPVAGWAGY